jgi:phenylpropionate dioxygenase-like ring-hydroxylating dioxygenase large terminal subunit
MDDFAQQEFASDAEAVASYKKRRKMSARGVRTLDRTKTIALAKRLIAAVKNKTVSLADGVMEVDTATYNDPVLYEKEMRAVFDRLPFIAGLSSELKDPGDYLNIDEFGTPILVTRNKQGVVKAFVNSCRHRGSALTFCRSGSTAGGFSCPYHGWSYNLDGKLLGVAHASDFGEVDKSELSLIEVMAEERHGIIFVTTKPGATFDLDWYLGPEMEEELSRWNLSELQLAKTGPIDLAGNWKLTLEAFLETYHFDVAHHDNLALVSWGQQTEVRPMGKHMFFGIPLKSILELENLPEEEWIPEEHILMGYILYPGILMNMSPSVCAYYSLYPIAQHRSGVRTSTYMRLDLSQAENQMLGEQTWENQYTTVLRQDYPFGITSPQKGIYREANPKFLFGRNELGLQHMLKVTRQLLAEAEEK